MAAFNLDSFLTNFLCLINPSQTMVTGEWITMETVPGEQAVSGTHPSAVILNRSILGLSSLVNFHH